MALPKSQGPLEIENRDDEQNKMAKVKLKPLNAPEYERAIVRDVPWNKSLNFVRRDLLRILDVEEE